MIKSKRYCLTILCALFCLSCSNNKPANNSVAKEDHKIVNGKKYVLTGYQDSINIKERKYESNNKIDTLVAQNDTVAYLSALKKFYNQKVIERQNSNYGQPKSFMIVDANGVDLKVNLPVNVVNGLERQVQSIPNIKTMLEEYQKDSL